MLMLLPDFAKIGYLKFVIKKVSAKKLVHFTRKDVVCIVTHPSGGGLIFGGLYICGASYLGGDVMLGAYLGGRYI